MYRPIEFRGKPYGSDEWVYGYVYQINNMSHIIVCKMSDTYRKEYAITVRPETLGQFTTKIDKNKKKIFEGDLVKVPAGYSADTRMYETIQEIKFDDSTVGFWLDMPDGVGWEKLEVVGNIHDGGAHGTETN